MNNLEFIPVLLGSDVNVYGMARSFHEQYGVNSIAVSKSRFIATIDTKIISFINQPNLEDNDCFVDTLISLSKKYLSKKLILIPCADGYMKLLVDNQKVLSKHYYFNCPSKKHLESLTIKESFYSICDKYNFKYPKTQVINYNNWESVELKLKFPIVIKASNSVEYWNCSFSGKKKVFIANQKSEYKLIIESIYASSYKSPITLQDYIPGNDSHMRVLNCYCSKEGRVKLMGLGHALLEDHTPDGIGSYTAIVNTFDQKLLDQIKQFLEEISYTGYVNFDIKYDIRDNQYKFFEINPRQGRSSFFVTACGCNLSKYLVDDIIYDKNTNSVDYIKNDCLWLIVPKKIIFNYIKDNETKARLKKLIQQGKTCNSLFYNKDLSFKRYMKLSIQNRRHYAKYKKYYGNKGLN